MSPALLAALALSLSEGQLSTLASIGLEARDTRYTQVIGVAPGTAFRELEAMPRLGVAWRSGALGTELAYRPRIVVSQIAPRVNVYHRAGLDLNWAAGRDLTLRLGLAGGYGELDATTPGAVAPAPGTVTPTPGTVVPTPAAPVGQLGRLRSTDELASLGAEVRILPTLMLALGGDYTYRGGIGTVDRASTPLERGPGGGLKIGWRADARNELSTEGSYAYRSYQTDKIDAVTGRRALLAPAWIARLGEGWSSQLSPEVASRLALGAATTSAAVRIGVVSEAQLEYRSRLGWSTRIQASLYPFIDPITGQVYDLVSGGLGAGGPLTSWLALTADGSVGEVVSGAQKGELFGRGELRLPMKVRADLGLTVGGRLVMQRPPRGAPPAGGVPLGSFDQWTVYLGMEWRPVGPSAR